MFKKYQNQSPKIKHLSKKSLKILKCQANKLNNKKITHGKMKILHKMKLKVKNLLTKRKKAKIKRKSKK